jgi:DNA-binding FadR family transcriptional regulator
MVFKLTVAEQGRRLRERPGDRNLPERLAVQRFRVSRSSTRAALSAL